MSRIDELNESISQREDSLKYAREVIALREPQLVELRKELAALKAESEKPREFMVSLGKAGNVVVCKGLVNELSHYAQDIHEVIPVIEKKPIVVTREMADKFHREYNKFGVYIKSDILLNSLKAVGIEARAGDE